MDRLAFFKSFFEAPERNGNGWSHMQNYPPGAEICRQGDSANGVYLIERGVVKLTRASANGRELIMDIRRSPWLIGVTAVILEKRYSFTAVSLVRSSLRFVPAEVFLSTVRNDSELSWQVMLLLSLNVIKERSDLEVIGCMSARERLEHLFCELMLEEDPEMLRKSCEFSVSLRNQELAEIIAVTPEHLCRLLKGMERCGIIRRSRGTITVTDSMSLISKWESRDICSGLICPLSFSEKRHPSQGPAPTTPCT